MKSTVNKMALKQPTSMGDLVYFTNRSIGKGKAKVWVFRKECPECGSPMGKPKDKKGKVKTRAKEYVCYNCSHQEEKQAYEDSLIANCEYICPGCGFKGETQIPYKRKNIDGVKTLRANCEKCNSNIDITKKMKEKKIKKSF